MEVKKSPKANLENNKTLYFLIGLVVALAAVFTAFEWGNREVTFQEISTNMVIEDTEDIEITPPDDNQAPPPPPPAPVITDEIKVVEDDKQLEDVEIINTDDNETKEPPKFSPPSAGTGRSETVSDDNQIFDFLEEMPEFPGGDVEMMKWLTSKIVYPPLAAENNIQGRVMIAFVVEKDGSVSDVKVVRGVDPYLDKEAMRVVKAMPKWKPGMQTGKPVRCRFTIPVNFKLR